jgi:hypothetical protein
VESTVTATFSDAFTGARLDNVNVIYNLRILDVNGSLVYERQNLTAQNGTDSQAIDFPSNENYRIEIQVQGIAEDGRPLDRTRSGVARGIVVVPEFPAGAAIAIAGLTASIIVVQRMRHGSATTKRLK